jgi:hypothetical protein
MSWLRIEGRMPQHRKVAPLSDAAFRLHVTAKCWCVSEESDGLIPSAIPKTLTAAPREKRLADVVAELMRAGLWEATEDGWLIHDFLTYNPSKAESQALRQARSAAGAAGGRSSGRARAEQARSKTEASASPIVEATSKQNSTPIPIPIPTPIPKNPTGSSGGGAAAPPAQPKRTPKPVTWPVDSWAGPTDAHRELAAEKGHDANYQADRMRDWARSKGERKADWDAAFRNWLHRQHPPQRDERSGTQIRLIPRGEDRHLQRVLRIEAEEKAAKEAFR